MAPYPLLNRTVLLVYRECICGWWCATGEGDVAPICPVCGRNPMPASIDRGDRGIGFVARAAPEGQAAAEVAKVPRGVGDPYSAPRHFTSEEISDDLRARKLPTEPMWEGGQPPWYPPPADAEPDWPAWQWTDVARAMLGLPPKPRDLPNHGQTSVFARVANDAGERGRVLEIAKPLPGHIGAGEFEKNDICLVPRTGEMLRVTNAKVNTGEIEVQRAVGPTTAAGGIKAGDEIVLVGRADAEAQ